MNAPSPIQALIENRCRDLALTAPDLIHRADYKNIAKGLRRLEALMTDDLVSSRGLIAKLPLALQLPPETITEAVEGTRRQIREREEQVYREGFNIIAKPYSADSLAEALRRTAAAAQEAARNKRDRA